MYVRIGHKCAVIGPCAGKAAESWMLTDISRLITIYYCKHPDPCRLEQSTPEFSNQLEKDIGDR